MQSKDYKKAGLFYLVGNLFNKGMAFFTVPIFTRILSTSDYGIVTTYNSWITILSMVIGFAMYMGIRAAYIDYKDNIDDFIASVTTFNLLCGCVATAVLCYINIWIKLDMGMFVLVLCLLQSLAHTLIQNYLMYLQMQYKYKYRTALMILPNLISVVLSILAILFIVKTDLYMGRIIPTALVNIVFGLYIVFLVYHKSHVFLCAEYIKYAFKISAPLVLHGIALNILSQSDRTMITLLSNPSQTGIYSLIYNFSMIATVVTTALDGIWVPWFMEKLQKKKYDEINSVASDYISLLTYVMTALILVGPEIVKVLAAEEYWEGIIIIPPVVLSNFVIFAYTLYVNIEHFHKRTLYITMNTIVAAVSNILLNLLLIPRFGYVAAAYTTLTAYMISFFLHSRYARKLESILYPLSYFGKSLFSISISVALFYLLVNSPIIRWVIAIGYLIAMMMFNRGRIRQFLKG